MNDFTHRRHCALQKLISSTDTIEEIARIDATALANAYFNTKEWDRITHWEQGEEPVDLSTLREMIGNIPDEPFMSETLYWTKFFLYIRELIIEESVREDIDPLPWVANVTFERPYQS